MAGSPIDNYRGGRDHYDFPTPATKRPCLEEGYAQFPGRNVLPLPHSAETELVDQYVENDDPQALDELWATFSQGLNDTGTTFTTDQPLVDLGIIGNGFCNAMTSFVSNERGFEFTEFESLLGPPQPIATCDSWSSTGNSEQCFPTASTQNELCFGMSQISDIPISAYQTNIMNFDSIEIPLSFARPDRLFQIGKDLAFGEVNDRTAKILSNIGLEEHMNFQIYCKTINKRAARNKKTGRKPGANELQYVMNVVIYGPEDLCDPVGDYLTQCNICLQTPLLCDRDVPYQNPQILCRSTEVVLTSTLLYSRPEPEVEKLVSSDGLFSHLSNSDDHLTLTEAPDAIITPLYTHQKKGLTFMMKREAGRHYDSSQDDLWVKEADEFGHMIYTNTITEMSQSHEPLEAKGGLLADQMGLGKSLTMISLIALNTCTATGVVFTERGLLQRLKSTLMVVPYSLLETWNTQLKRHLRPNSLSWIRFHGSQKRKTLSLGQFDIVMTTFETLASEQKKHLDPKYTKDTLFSFFWHRIVLDEGKLFSRADGNCADDTAHTIRNRATAIARASSAIKATSRWAITGTPIQNRVTDFASLLEFLQISPFSNPKTFDKEITKPWLKSEDRDVTRLKKLVRCISLCRTKAIINLPKRQDFIRNLKFSPEEQEMYDKAKEGTIKKLDLALSSNPLQPGQYLNALQWLNELRLLCNHGLAHARRDPSKAVEADPLQAWNKTTAKDAFRTLICSGEASCSVCLDILRDSIGGGGNTDVPKPHLFKCLTLVCGFCSKSSSKSQPGLTCSHNPPCKSFEVAWSQEPISASDAQEQLPQLLPQHVSTKLKTLLEDLKACPEDEKSVVFSYWTFTLDLVESLLRQASISYTRIDGRYSGAKREEAIQMFQTDDTIKVILVSITCGGAGLDLTAASVAYLLEPQWNPMMEEQALCRIHRLGQRKEVKTVRYRIKGSFEERVVATQELKEGIAAEAFGSEVRGDVLTSMRKLQA
ncbi:DNA repair protein RAD5A, partial [Lachnellula suecica]